MRNLISRFGLALVGLAITGFTAQAQFTLSGTLTYTGRQTGQVWIAPSLNGSTPILAKKIPLGALQDRPFTNAAFALTNLDAGGTYHVLAWRDSITNSAPDITEAKAWHPDSPFLMDNNRSVTGFTIADPDLDTDALPDWWEDNFGLNNRIGTGRSGALSVHAGQTNFTDTVRATVVGSNPSGNTLNVTTTNGFATNDLVLIITMQDTNLNFNLNAAGTYEFGRIASLNQGGGATNLVLTAPHANTFTPGTAQKIQVLKVPEYTEVSLAGSALSFDGTNDYVVFNRPVSNDFTLECWFQSTNRTGLDGQWWEGGGLVDGEVGGLLGDFGLTLSAGKVLFGTGGSADKTIRSAVVADGQWHHAAATRHQSSGAMRLYVDGQLVAEDINSAGIPLASPPQMRLGSLATGVHFFQGRMGEVRLWTKVRSQAEIQFDMNRVLSGNEPGLATCYRLEEGTDLTARDLTANQRDGKLSGPEWIPGVRGSALAFDGMDDRVDVPDGVYFNGNFTIEAWVYPRAHSIWARVLDFGIAQQHILLTFCDNVGLKPHVRVGGSTYTAPGALRPNEWVHLAATVSGSTCVIYTNGVVAGSGPVSVPANVVRTSNKIAASSVTTEPNANVQLDEIRVWNVARTPAEIASTMGETLTGQEPGLVAHWRFDEGAGAVLRDASPHGQDGVLTGGPAWVSPSLMTCQPWNGTNGGVLAFKAHHVMLGRNSAISADGKGYRGGAAVAQGTLGWGIAGERTTGFSGTSREANSLERLQGGGGAGRGSDGSGGGGCYASQGGDGGYLWYQSDYGRGASTLYGLASLSRLYPGGGGGGTGSHSDGRNGVGGGAGGGILSIEAGRISGNGTISSRGASGQPGVLTVDHAGSGGGGGAGGSVYLLGNAVDSLQVFATGGAGGAASLGGALNRDGGAGGLGRIRLDLPPSAVSPFVDPPAGYVQRRSAGNSALWSSYSDTDQDGLSDLVEYQLDTDPVDADTDGDTLPDVWEVAHGLNPRNASDAASGVDRESDGVSNLIEFQRGTRPDLADTDGDGLSDAAELFVHHTDPLRSDSDGDGMHDNTEVLADSDPLFAGTQYFYDAIDRLVGVQHENGLALGYAYDRNNNLVRQFYAVRDQNTNALPDLWEFLNGLTNSPSAFTDSDGDGWSDYQEWQAATSPTNAANAPNLTGEGSQTLASQQWPFTPSNFVTGVGQLDGLGAEEIVIGADGNPGTATNFLLVLTQASSSWSTQRVDIGRSGVTSIAVGQPANRPRAAIYVGLRQTGGFGKVVEFASAGNGQWISNSIATSAYDAAFVHGVRAGQDILASQAGTDSPPGSAYSLSFTTAGGWKARLGYTTASQRGLGTLLPSGLSGVPALDLRLLDAGGIQAVHYDMPTNALWNGAYGRWFFLTPTQMTWDQAQAYARQFGGNLATVNDGALNRWLIDNFFSAAGANGFWIGLSRPDCASQWQWAGGAPVSFTAWTSGQPDCAGLNEGVVHVWNTAGWNDHNRSFTTYGLVEVAGDPPGAVWNNDYSRLFFRTPSTMTWSNSQTYARQMGGNLATVNNATLNSWLWTQFKSAGDTWIGLVQANTSSPWQWISGVPVSYTNWSTGEPNGSGVNGQMYAANGRWDDLSPTSLMGVIEVGSARPTLLAGEPAAARRLLWRGHSLNTGNLRLTGEVSILYTFVDDKNLNAVIDAGDDFVVTEYLYAGGGVFINAPCRIPLSGSILAQSYGLSSVDVLYGNQQVFFTAEPDGRVFSWSAADATTPLQRQLFSGQHTGKAWHALAGVKAVNAGQNLLGLRVDPTAPNRCDVILWPPQSELWVPAEVPQTAPITGILPTPAAGRDIARVDIRIWDAEGSPATPELAYQRTSESAWSNATIAVSCAVNGLVTTSPVGLTNQLFWDSARDLGPGFTNTVQLRARAHDITLTGDWSPPVAYTVQNSLTNSLWATNDVASTPMNTPVNIDVLGNDNCSPKFIAGLGVPAHGLAVTNLNKTVRYTPAPGFVGTDQFTYTLTDGAGGFDMANITVTVTAGAPPVILLGSPALQGGNQFSLTITGPAGTYEVIASTNLTDWSHVSWVTNSTGTVPFTEPVAPNARTRFYRAIRVE